MKKLLTILAILGALLIAGCGTQLPSPQDLEKKTANFKLPKLPEEGKAIVYIVRPAKVGYIIRFNVFLDDKKEVSQMGSTKGKQYIYFNLQPGTHTILSKAENWATFSVDNVKAGDILFIKQEVIFGALYARNALKEIPEAEGKYYASKLKLGTIYKQDK